MGDGGTALGAEETVHNVPGGALGAGVGLDGAFDGELVLLDDSDESWRDCMSASYSSISEKRQSKVAKGWTYSRSSHSDAGSHRSGRNQQGGAPPCLPSR